MYRILQLLLFVSLLTSCETTTEAPTTENRTTPNIVVIFTDDLGYGDLSTYGSPITRTPRLDAMAAGGMKFTSFYAMPSCSPSRAALLTGCYPPRVGIPDVVGPPGPAWTANKQYGLHPEETTLPEILKEAGYATGIVGKWHLGHFAETMPLQHGFDQFFGLPYSNDMLPEKGYGNLALLSNTDTLEQNPDQSQLTRRYTEEALNFIRAQQDTSFFLYLAHSMPHVPIFASEDFLGKSGAGLYADVIAEIDASAGRILDELKTLGLEENTLVIFTSDNGPWLTYGNHAGSAGPFREGKGTTWEGGMRVPMIAYWPGTIEAGKITHTPAALPDLLPTLAAVSEADLPERKIDGRDLSQLLTTSIAPAAAPICYYRSGKLEAVRLGNWKLHVAHYYRSVTRVGNDGERGAYTYDTQTDVALYDLGGDPGEVYNVAEEQPEKTAELMVLAEKISREMAENKRGPWRPDTTATKGE